MCTGDEHDRIDLWNVTRREWRCFMCGAIDTSNPPNVRKRQRTSEIEALAENALDEQLRAAESKHQASTVMHDQASMSHVRALELIAAERGVELRGNCKVHYEPAENPEGRVAILTWGDPGMSERLTAQ